MHYDDDALLITVVITGVLLVIILFLAITVNSCTSITFKNGTVADKYREQYGAPHLVIEKDGDYGDINVTEEDYLKYDIGEVYAQE